ncbi:nrps5 single domain, non-ribosomal peptide synthase-like protein [Microsporum canis]
MANPTNTLLDHFYCHVQRYPASIAIEDGTKSADESAWERITYLQLDTLSDIWARKLSQAGVGAGCIVPIISRRSIAMVAAVLAVLKLRAVYVPVDIDSWGKDRIDTVLTTIDPKVIVSTVECPEDRYSFPVLILRETNPDRIAIGNGLHSGQKTSKLGDRGGDLAYIIFTSGTTGKPKGVMVGLKSISRYVKEGGDLPFNFNTKYGTRVLLICSVAFDGMCLFTALRNILSDTDDIVCAGVVFNTLCNGGTLVLADPSTLEAAAKTCHVLPLTPSILSSLNPKAGFDRVEKIFLGGEAPTESLIRSWYSSCRRLYNSYGPTETTCTSLMGELVPGSPITIGYPISYSTVTLLDEDGSDPSQGEICISGLGLALGYFRDRDRTASSFVRLNGRMVYRTGDYGKHTRNGLQFCGRKDSMVKNRGFLINLEGDVEPALLSFSKVARAAASMSNGKLIAFVTPTAAKEGLREYLLGTISSFLVPDIVYSLDEFPVTANGKADRRSLLRIHEEAQGPNGNLETGLNAIEALRRGMAYVLQIPELEIAGSSSFRDLGGHSLAAVMLVSNLRQMGFTIGVTEVLLLDTVDKMASAMKETVNDAHASSMSEQLMRRLENIIPMASLAGSESFAPMTDIQSRMVRASVATPGLSFIKASFTLDHPGREDFTSILRAAWGRLNQRHHILRASFVLGEPGAQVVYRDPNIAWKEKIITETDWESACRHEEELGLGQFTGFEPGEQRCLSQVTVLVIPANRTRFIWTVHHSLIDGWSMATLMRDFASCLDKIPLSLPPQFTEVALATEQLNRKSSSKAASFWKGYLNGYVPVHRLRLPPSSDVKDYTQATLSRKLTVSVSTLESAAKDRFAVTPATLLYAAWGILIARYSGTDRTLLGAVLSGRNLDIPGVEDVIGPLINTLPLKVDATGSQSTSSFVHSVFRALCEILDYQWSSFAVIQEGSGCNPAKLFETLFALQYDFPQAAWESTEAFSPRDVRYTEATEVPLTVLLDRTNGRFDVRFIYRRSYFDKHIIQRMFHHFDNVLTALTNSHPDADISMITQSIFSPIEYKSLTAKTVQSDSFTSPKSLVDALENAIETYPSIYAVEGLSQSLTYKEFGDITAQVAGQLGRHIQRGSVVCVVSDGSILWVTAMIAVIRAGAVYCPVDQKLPQARMKYMVENCRASLIVYCNVEQHLVVNDVPCLSMPSVMSDISSTSMAKLTSNDGSDTDGIACLVYTSGSTGFPKGVPLTHKGILNVISHEDGRLCSIPGQRNAQMLSLGFDCCIKEVFSTLCFGATLVLKDPENPIAHLARVDATMATASLLATLEPDDLPGLGVIMVAGESLPQALADKWASGRILINGYAPAESTLIATVARISTGDKVSIGKPFSGMSCYILDSKLRPAPIGVSGEICLSGVQVTPGYLHNEQETAKRYIQDPFHPEQAMFRTGDIGRRLENGNVEFIGREDNQIKLRGFRIDLGEVQSTFSRVATDASNVALLVSNGNLIAFVTPSTIDVESLGRRLESQLPEYAVPRQIIPLSALPTSANDKVDMSALEMHLTSHLGDNTNHENLKTPTQRALAAVWAEVLGCELSQMSISPNTRFFELGGHSLLQIKVAQTISKRWDIHPMPLRQVIRYQNLQALSSAIDELLTIATRPYERKPFLDMTPVARDAKLPLSFLEEEMFVNHLISGCSPAGNMSFVCKISGVVDYRALANAFQQVAADEEIFRARYHLVDGVMARYLAEGEVNLTQVVEAVDYNHVIHKTVTKSFDLSAEPPLEVVIITGTPMQAILVIVMSHVIGDATTMATYLERASTAYELLRFSNTSAKSVPKTDKLTYIDWVRWTESSQASPQSQKFWPTYLSNLPKPLTFGNHSSGKLTYTGSTRSWTLPDSMLRSITHLATRASVTMHHIVLAAVFFGLQCIDCRDDIVFAAPFTHRMERGTESIPGLFLDRLLIRVQRTPHGEESLFQFLSTVRESSQRALEHVIPYREVCRLLSHKPSFSDPLFKVMVTCHTASDRQPVLNLKCAEIQNIPYRNTGASKFPLSLEFTVTHNNDLRVDMEYDFGPIEDDVALRLEFAIGFALQLMVLEMNPSEIITLGVSSFGPGKNGTTITDRQRAQLRVPTLDQVNPNSLEDSTRIISKSICRCLGLEENVVDVQKSFWELGAQSIDALRLQNLCSRQRLRISLRDIFASDSISQLVTCARIIDI